MMRSTNGSRSRARDTGRGQAIVEFALVIPIFFLVFVGIAEGGYYVAATTFVSHATHEGVRFGVLESTADAATVRTRVQERAAPVVSVAPAAVSLRLNSSACDDVCYADRVQGDRLMVRTAYTHVPLLGSIFGGLTIPADAEAELLVE